MKETTRDEDLESLDLEPEETKWIRDLVDEFKFDDGKLVIVVHVGDLTGEIAEVDDSRLFDLFLDPTGESDMVVRRKRN